MGRLFTVFVLVLLVVITGSAALTAWFLFGDPETAPFRGEYESPPSLPYQPPSRTSTGSSGDSPRADVSTFDVPFFAQAPSGNWGDPRQQDGCEEASALMTMLWLQGKTLTTAQAEAKIIAIAEYQLENYGVYNNTSAADTVSRIFKGYFDYDGARVRYDVDAQDIRKELEAGNVVIAFVNGQALSNPYFTPPGPLEHAVVVVGYGAAEREFIVNDPGTRSGRGFRYSERTLERALQDYPTGKHLPITVTRSAIIVVSPDA